jgi:hypothetical protein
MAEQIQFLTPEAPNTCLSTTNAANCCSASWSGSGYNPVYAQPLYIYQATVTGASGGKANIVIVATLTDEVFAYDASATQSTTNPCNSSVPWGKWYWVRNLLDGGSSGDCYTGTSAGSPISQPGPAIPAAGILSTPAAYVQDNVVYVVGGCQTVSGSIHWYLHGLSLADGTDKFTPIDIGSGVYAPASSGAAGVSPSGCTTNCVVQFQAQYQLQRPALLLDNGNIWIGFGVGNGSETSFSYPYHGWLMAYPASGSGGASFAFASTTVLDPSGSPFVACSSDTSAPWTNECGLGGGIWRNPAVFAGENNYVLAGIGNGGFQASGYGTSTAYSYGESVVSFVDTTTCTTSSTPTACNPGSFFTPSTFGTLNVNDQDMGASSILVTDSSAGSSVVAIDKSGQGYVLSPTGLPGYNSTDCSGCEFAGSLTSRAAGVGGGCFGGLGTSTTPCDSVFSQVYWNIYLFLWPRGEDFDWCYWTGSVFVCDPQTGYLDDYNLSPSGFPGGSLTLSANGTTLSSAILWGVLNPTQAKPYIEPDSAPSYFSGHLRAYELVTAPNSTTSFVVDKLWTSQDQWLASVFALPVVANGSVYVPTFDSGVLVYHP